MRSRKFHTPALSAINGVLEQHTEIRGHTTAIVQQLDGGEKCKGCRMSWQQLWMTRIAGPPQVAWPPLLERFTFPYWLSFFSQSASFVLHLSSPTSARVPERTPSACARRPLPGYSTAA
jgi:hypothetical protein